MSDISKIPACTASNLGFFIDGEAYYGSLYRIFSRARRTIYIPGWDFDSRIRLVRHENLASDTECHMPALIVFAFLAGTVKEALMETSAVSIAVAVTVLVAIGAGYYLLFAFPEEKNWIVG